MGIFNGIFYFFSPSCFFSQKSQYRYFKNIWLGDVKLVHQYALHKRPATQLHNVCTYMVTLPVGGLHCRVSRKTLKSQQQAHRTTATSLVHVLGKQLTAKQTPESTWSGCEHWSLVLHATRRRSRRPSVGNTIHRKSDCAIKEPTTSLLVSYDTILSDHSRPCSLQTAMLAYARITHVIKGTYVAISCIWA